MPRVQLEYGIPNVEISGRRGRGQGPPWTTSALWPASRRAMLPPGGRRSIMSNDASFVGSIPQHYDQGMGPMIFVDYAADIAQRVAAASPARVLETAAGTGIVTRKLRDALPAAARLAAPDLNPPMLDIARAKFRAGEQVEFQPAD